MHKKPSFFFSKSRQVKKLTDMIFFTSNDLAVSGNIEEYYFMRANL